MGEGPKREAASERFIAAKNPKEVAKASPKSRAAVKEASTRRSAALKRLADR
jgi:hypothetical protein